ncbi:MAG: hypothetical protein SFW67_04440 [Myxococcaceae bacterium]|nr:hypothetical protein [Myxococcaceae bacterium]
MKRSLVMTAVVSSVAGFGLGALVFSRSEAPAAQPRSPPPEPVVRVVERERVVVVPGAAPPSTAPTPPAPGQPDQPVEGSPPVSPVTVTALEAKVQDLERQLAIEKQLRVGVEGVRVEPPKDLPRRFRDEKQLLETFNSALKAAGFAEAEVENIDCTEHPCIVFGRGFGERTDMERLKPFLGAYEKDEFSTIGYVDGEGPTAKRFFGVAVMPDDTDDSLGKRINHRVQQLYEVSKPPHGGPQTK